MMLYIDGTLVKSNNFIPVKNQIEHHQQINNYLDVDKALSFIGRN